MVYTPGGGTAPPNAKLNVLGIGFEIAVVEGGYALLTKENLHASEDWRTSHAQVLDRLVTMDVWAMLATKAWDEGCTILEAWDLELNPAVSEFERLDCAEAWELVLNP